MCACEYDADGGEGKDSEDGGGSGGNHGFAVSASPLVEEDEEEEEEEEGEEEMEEGGGGEGDDRLSQLPDDVRERLVSLCQEKYVHDFMFIDTHTCMYMCVYIKYYTCLVYH